MFTSEIDMKIQEIYKSTSFPKWKKVSDIIDFAFQPIVNTYTGDCYGFEVLLRNHKEAGFDTIQDIFNTAFDEKSLFILDLLLRKKALNSLINSL